MKSKTTNGNNRIKILSLIISICNFCILIIYGVLNHLFLINEIFIVISYSIFAIILLLGILNYTKKKPAFFINYDRWKEKIFKMEEKYTSIIIDGAYKAIFVLIYILLLMFLNLLPLEYITLKDILFLIVVLFIVPLFEGYLDYMLYSSKKLEK